MYISKSVGVMADFLNIFRRLEDNYFFWEKVLFGLGSSIITASLLWWKCRSDRISDSYHKSRYQPSEDRTSHSGSCYCERVKFEIIAPRNLKAVDIPSKLRFPRVSIPFTDFYLLCEESILSISYKKAVQYGMNIFCSYCGVQIMYSPSENPIYIQINADCLDHSTIQSIDVSFYTTGEEETLQANHSVPSINSDTPLARRGSGYLPPTAARTAVLTNGTDFGDEDDNLYTQFFDRESVCSASSSTTMTYDFEPSQKLQQHLLSGSEKAGFNLSGGRPSSSSSRPFGRSVRGLDDGSIGSITPTPSDFHQQQQQTPLPVYDELFRHASNRRVVPDWTRGVNYVYSSLQTNGIVGPLRDRDRDVDRDRRSRSSSSLRSVSGGVQDAPPPSALTPSSSSSPLSVSFPPSSSSSPSSSFPSSSQSVAFTSPVEQNSTGHTSFPMDSTRFKGPAANNVDMNSLYRLRKHMNL